MDIATKCQTHSAIKSHSKKEYIIRLLFDEKGYEIGYASTGEIVRCKECKHWDEEDYKCNIRDSYGWNYKPDDFCSYGERSEE